MSINPLWTPEMDDLLKKIVTQQPKPINWKFVLKQLVDIEKINIKTSKQCYKRWCQIENCQDNFVNWTIQQEQFLLEKQNQIGNKWLQLSHYFPGRHENCLKNQFYSIFRRALRRVNKQIYIHKGNSVRPITTTIILKILSIAQQKFDRKKKDSQELIKISQEIKKILIEYSNPNDNSQKQQNAKNVDIFIQKINIFRKESKGKKLKVKVKKQQVFQSSQQNIFEGSVQKQFFNNEKYKQILPIHPFLGLSQTIYQKQLEKSIKTQPSPPPPLLQHINFSFGPYVETNGIIQQQICPFPIPSLLESLPNRYFTVLKPVTLSLQDSMLFYQNFCRKPQDLQSSLLVNSNSYIKLQNQL